MLSLKRSEINRGFLKFVPDNNLVGDHSVKLRLQYLKKEEHFFFL